MISLLLSALFGLGIAHAAEPSLTVYASYPAAGTVAKGAQRVPMMVLKLQASCAAPVTLDTITVWHEGFGSTSDISGVYALKDARRVTRSASFNRTTAATTLRFRGYAIPACKTETLTLYADFSTDAASTASHVLTLRSSGDIDANEAKVTVSTGSAARAVRTGAISKGTITVAYLPLTRRVDYGVNRVVARLRLSADKESRQAIDAITFTNDGKARDGDLKNLWIGNTRGERLSDFATQMDDERVRIVFSKPLIIDKNSDVTLELHADALASRTRTIEFEIEEASDIEARPVSGRGR